MMPGQPYALQVIHPGSPTLRIRYRHGILVDPFGFPDWLLYARALVRVGPPRVGRAAQRVLDVLAANEAMARTGDPLWTVSAYIAGTPAGWVWTPLRDGEHDRRLALVPADLHGSYRHAGGYRTMPTGAPTTLTDGGSHPVRWRPSQLVAAEVIADVETALGHRLPPAYRQFLARTNGGAPEQAAVLPSGGFVADQPWFGVGAQDRQQDLLYANAWLRDRFSPRYLAVGYVQGGLLVVDVTDDSIWFWDDDDPRASEGDSPTQIEAQLIRCADSVDGFLDALVTPGGELLQMIDALVDAGDVAPAHDDLAGSCLPPRARPAWQTGLDKAAATDPLARLLDTARSNPGEAPVPTPAPAVRAPTAPAPAVAAPVVPAPAPPPVSEHTAWQPANDVEAGMAEALRIGDQRRYADLLADSVLYLPGFGAQSGTTAPTADGQPLVTWTIGGRPHLAVFTSVPAMLATLNSAEIPGTPPDRYLTTNLAELTAAWPDPSWRLVVNPHVPIGVALDIGAIPQIRAGQVTLTTLDALVEEAARAEPTAPDPVEAALDRAVESDEPDAFFATLRDARAYLPIDDTGEWIAVPVGDGTVHVVAFTSAERCAQWLPEEFGHLEMFEIAMTDLARDWPGPQFLLSLNPDTPVAVLLDAAEVARIADG